MTDDYCPEFDHRITVGDEIVDVTNLDPKVKAFFESLMTYTNEFAKNIPGSRTYFVDEYTRAEVTKAVISVSDALHELSSASFDKHEQIKPLIWGALERCLTFYSNQLLLNPDHRFVGEPTAEEDERDRLAIVNSPDYDRDLTTL